MASPFSSFDPNTLLTLEEAQAIEQTVLPAQERFLIRVALYSLRYLKPMAEQEQISLNQLSPELIYQWLEQDETLLGEEHQSPGFLTWYGQFLIASLNQLRQAGEFCQVSPEELSLAQVITWFRAQAQARLSP
ncbi:hypothetical protein [Synechococcus sp. PCC 6312]|uniref:hypothetical protein n=1 Tax=Synechococcus sp. (strain ATCC 27167 / PCC 6312) TaxID=195253 RepID=UPI00029EE6DE|nr:hypothetical protein [Synechococcus sp. PCC 6312]AFY59269.1 hypothetical protein Syn6312_0009 [Synechococcus sp. PCC 6312]